ncbi:glycine zipper domain-containing protein [Undibacterium terreum]|uniref:DUF883 domain-containing protein n=1 Tax=Undibacterium terreum TaxID=1224302 RepID=A0A916XEN8_9BURK|nr:DUF883 family protein [Undibacterium terreum]GGC64878.1 hypothetical protein GCM10011396_09890 [Undibacterium terreum]
MISNTPTITKLPEDKGAATPDSTRDDAKAGPSASTMESKTADALSAGASAAADSFKSYISRLDAAVGSVKDTFQENVDATVSRVQDNPLKTVAVAAGIGILIGMIIGRR